MKETILVTPVTELGTRCCRSRATRDLTEPKTGKPEGSVPGARGHLDGKVAICHGGSDGKWAGGRAGHQQWHAVPEKD